MNHRLRRLRLLFSSTEHPRLPLPRSPLLQLPQSDRSPPPSPCHIPPPLLKDLGHIFSCIGTFVVSAERKRCLVAVNSVREEEPWKFFENFGGNFFSRPGRGATRPDFRWQAYGDRAQKVALILAPHGGRKAELLSVVGGMTGEVRADKGKMRVLEDFILSRTKILKDQYFIHGKVSSWEEMTELLDSKGQISSIRASNKVRLCINHGSEDLIASIPRFLEAQPDLPRARLPSVTPSLSFDKLLSKSAWDVQGLQICAYILENALKTKLVLQKEKAEKALIILKKREHLILQPKSNLKRYKRLSEENARLSAVIDELRRMKNFWKKHRMEGRGANAMESKKSEEILTSISLSRELRKKQSEIVLMRKDIRLLLRGCALSLAVDQLK